MISGCKQPDGVQALGVSCRPFISSWLPSAKIFVPPKWAFSGTADKGAKTDCWRS